MTKELRDQIAAAVVLITDARQDPEHIHKLLEALCDQAHNEGYMVGLERGEEIVNKHLGKVLGALV